MTSIIPNFGAEPRNGALARFPDSGPYCPWTLGGITVRWDKVSSIEADFYIGTMDRDATRLLHLPKSGGLGELVSWWFLYVCS